jgi:hypothetical protein
MADVKISELPAGTANASAVVPATNAAGTLTEKITLGAIAGLAAPTMASPAEITDNQDDYTLAAGDILRLTSDAAYSISGIAAGDDAEARLLINVGAHDLTLKHEDAASSAANRLVVPWAGDYVMSAGGGAALVVYDGTSDRWRVV